MPFPLALVVACAATAVGYAAWPGVAKIVGVEV